MLTSKELAPLSFSRDASFGWIYRPDRSCYTIPGSPPVCKTITSHPPGTDGGNQSLEVAVGVDVTATFGVELVSDSHILVRTSENNPFEETWAWGNVRVVGKFDLRAEAFLSVRYAPDPLEVVSKTCIPGLCWGAKIAGVGVSLGVSLGVSTRLEVTFDARLTFTYGRYVSSDGQIRTHIIRDTSESSGYKFELERTGFNTLIESGTEPALTFQIDASVSASIIPEIEVGVFGNGNILNVISLQAEVAAVAKIDFNLRADLRVRTVLSSGSANPLSALPSCSEGAAIVSINTPAPACCSISAYPPYCNDICKSPHDLKFKLVASGTLYVFVKFAYNVAFGPFNDAKNFLRYLVISDPPLTQDERPLLTMSIRIFSLCYSLPGAAEDPSPSLPPSPPSLPSPSPPPPCPSLPPPPQPQRPPPPPQPPLAPCAATCSGYNCDYWITRSLTSNHTFTCDELTRNYGCDCAGC